MASSIINPIAAAKAPNVIILKVCPNAYNKISVKPNIIGIVIKMTVLDFKERKNKMATNMANPNPIHKLSVTLLMESCTNSA